MSLSENQFLLFFVGPTGSQILTEKIVEKTKDLCVNPLKSHVQCNIFQMYKIKWGPDEDSAPDFALNSYQHPSFYGSQYCISDQLKSMRWDHLVLPHDYFGLVLFEDLGGMP